MTSYYNPTATGGQLPALGGVAGIVEGEWDWMRKPRPNDPGFWGWGGGLMETARGMLGGTGFPGLFNTRRAGDPLDDYRTRYRQFLETEGEEARASRAKQRGYNPLSYAGMFAEAASNRLMRPYMEAAEELMGQQVGLGRLRTGMGMEDQRRQFRDMYAQPLAEQIGLAAPTFAGLELENITQRARAQDRYGDVLGSAYDLELARQNAKRKKKGGILGALGGLAGGIGGFFLGGPAGAYAGAGIGSSLGSSFA